MKEEQQVPPGIVRFKTKEGTLYFQYPHSDYDNWVRFHLSEGSTIHTISVDGKEWSVGDNTSEGIIESFHIGSQSETHIGWIIKTDRRGAGQWLNNWVTKLPPPSQQDRSVSQPGKELFEWVTELPTKSGYYTIRYWEELGQQFISENQGFKADGENKWSWDYVPNRVHHRPHSWLKKVSQPSQPGDGKGENEKQHDRNSKDWDLWNSALKANAPSKKSLEQLLYEGEISGFQRKPPLPEQADNAIKSLEFHFHRLAEYPSWIEIKTELATLRAESQAKDTRIKELVEYVRDYRNLLDEYQSNYELVIKLDEFLKPYTP